MKTNLKTLLLVVALYGTITVQANDYVMLHPLDTSTLPAIPDKDYSCTMVRSTLNSDVIWDNIQKQL